MNGLPFARKLHLWIGLLLSVVLLVEAVTGLMLAKPKLFGQQAGNQPASYIQAQAADPAKVAQEDGRPPVREDRAHGAGAPGGFSAKALHKGIVGGVDLSWLVALSGIGLIILVLTGVHLAIPHLRKRRRN